MILQLLSLGLVRQTRILALAKIGIGNCHESLIGPHGVQSLSLRLLGVAQLTGVVARLYLLIGKAVECLHLSEMVLALLVSKLGPWALI